MPSHRNPCGRCEDVLRVIDEWSDLNGYPPTLAEVGNLTGITSASMVVYHADELVERGYLRKTPGIARATTITDEGRAAARVARGAA